LNQPLEPESPPKLQQLCLAVVGHIEWVDFLAVDHWPQPGLISHAKQRLEEPAGAGAVIAVQLAQLVDRPVHFFTALGRDSVGEACVQRLQDRGVAVHVAWRDAPTRRGISLVDEGGDRGITVIGDRLTPVLSDPLPWDVLRECDGAFITAADAALVQARQSCSRTGSNAAGWFSGVEFGRCPNRCLNWQRTGSSRDRCTRSAVTSPRSSDFHGRCSGGGDQYR